MPSGIRAGMRFMVVPALFVHFFRPVNRRVRTESSARREIMSDPKTTTHLDRRAFLEKSSKGIGFFLMGGVTGKLLSSTVGEEMVWQIDPLKCIQCEKCTTACVLTPSASKCV